MKDAPPTPVAERASLNPLEWVERYGVLESGATWTWDGHEYLRELFEDHHPYKVAEKCAQIGVTSAAILQAFWACDELGLSVIYYFPTDGDVLDFSAQRVKPMIAESDHLRALVGSQLDNVRAKRVGRGFLHLRGMKSNVKVKSVPGDLLIFDELDEAEPKQKQKALYRLEASAYKWVLELSNPTIPDYGIDIEYQASDRRHWLVQCERCAVDNCLEDEWPNNVDGPVSGLYLACKRCRGRLDVRTGRWVAKYPSITERRGYHFCGLMNPRANFADMLKKYHDPRTRAEFMRLGMGMPYVDGKQRLTAQEVLRCKRPYSQRERMRKRPCTLGADVGNQLHVQVSADGPHGNRRAVWIGTVDDFDGLGRLMDDFRIECAVVDAQPDIHASRKFAEAHNGRVWLCRYIEQHVGPPVWNEDKLTVSVNRTAEMDATRLLFLYDEGAGGRPGLELPHDSPALEEYARHCTAVVKVEKEHPETGAKTWRYVRTADDHFFHAANYDRLAWEHGGGESAGASVDPEDAEPDHDDESLEGGWARRIFGR